MSNHSLKIINEIIQDVINRSISETCPICLGEMMDKKMVKCHHNFHKECIDKWLEIKNTCPVCREEVREKTTDEVQRELDLDFDDDFIYDVYYSFRNNNENFSEDNIIFRLSALTDIVIDVIDEKNDHPHSD